MNNFNNNLIVILRIMYQNFSEFRDKMLKGEKGGKTELNNLSVPNFNINIIEDAKKRNICVLLIYLYCTSH